MQNYHSWAKPILTSELLGHNSRQFLFSRNLSSRMVVYETMLAIPVGMVR